MLQPAPQREGSEPAAGSMGALASSRTGWLKRRRIWAGALAAAVVVVGGTSLVGQRRSAQQQTSLADYTVVAPTAA